MKLVKVGSRWVNPDKVVTVGIDDCGCDTPKTVILLDILVCDFYNPDVQPRALTIRDERPVDEVVSLLNATEPIPLFAVAEIRWLRDLVEQSFDCFEGNPSQKQDSLMISYGNGPPNA